MDTRSFLNQLASSLRAPALNSGANLSVRLLTPPPPIPYPAVRVVLAMSSVRNPNLQFKALSRPFQCSLLHPATLSSLQRPVSHPQLDYFSSAVSLRWKQNLII